MIAQLTGKVLEKNEGEVIIGLESGIAFSLQCSMTTLSTIPIKNSNCTLHTHFHVRQDAMELFGFATKDELKMFRRLISVSGIGPRSALFVLGSMPLNELKLAILSGDTAALSRAPGIGKKTAQRISLELKDPLTKDALNSGEQDSTFLVGEDVATTNNDSLSEAIQALKSLGYSPQEATSALKSIPDKQANTDTLIKQALRYMAQRS